MGLSRAKHSEWNVGSKSGKGGWTNSGHIKEIILKCGAIAASGKVGLLHSLLFKSKSCLGNSMPCEGLQRTTLGACSMRNCKKCSGKLCDRNMPLKLKGKIQNSVKVSIAVWGRDMSNNERPRK